MNDEPVEINRSGSVLEPSTYRCPHCRAEIRNRYVDGQQVDCPLCHRSFHILRDESTAKVVFVPLETKTVQEPLHLPRGSVRAAVTLVIASSCWLLMLADQPVPGCLLSLLLTIIGYYFGFRQRLRDTESRIYDASAPPDEPLNLQGGSIRLLLIFGFIVCGAILGVRRRLVNPAYLEFFMVLAGLVAGYFFARLSTGAIPIALSSAINHAKGAGVLLATVVLAVVLLMGFQAVRPQLGRTLACFISFYFGSRS